MPFTLTMPKLSPTMEEGSIAKWHKNEGDRVEVGDLLFEVSTDKATVEHCALDEGWLRKILVPEGGAAVVNQPVAVMTEEKAESIEEYKPEGVEAVASPEEKKAEISVHALSEKKEYKAALAKHEMEGRGRVFASPLAKKLARERGINLHQVVGSGPRGRVMSRDLEVLKEGKQKEAMGPAGAFTVEALTPVRKVVAQRLQEAKATIPHFYVRMTLDAQPLVDFREQLKSVGVLVSVNDCVVKACALALTEHPEVNSGFNAKDNSLIRFQSIDVSVAVSIPEGLITPIVVHADSKPLSELSAEIRTLAKKAKAGKLELHEFQGGSFTVSNLGMYGIAEFQAIINPPQAAIVAVGAVINVPVVKDGAVVPGKEMSLCLSVDHRVIDGVAAAQFLQTVKKFIENPVSLLVR